MVIANQPDLATWAVQYGPPPRKQRPPADPIGLRGLPEFRPDLDSLLREVCARLEAAGGAGIRSAQLVIDLTLRDRRALRLLVAYGRVIHHHHEIVGVPGDRYYWGDAVPGLYRRAIRDCERRARCYFFIAALHKRQGTAMAAAQLVFDFMEYQVPAERRHNDDLAALVASEGYGVDDVLDAMVTKLADTPEGRAMLAKVGQKHAEVLLPADVLRELADQAGSLRDRLLAAVRS